jgi:hypothetical protein
MPDPVFIQGYLGTITINSDPIITANVLNFNQTKNIMTKPVIGSADAFSLTGQSSGSVSLQGHVSVTQLPELQAIFDLLVPVAFTIQVGDAAGATDAGLYSGLLSLGNLNLTATADGEWDYTADGQTSGNITYTPGSP